MIVIIGVLVVVITGLMIYNIIIYKKLETFNNINQKVNGLNILQDFMDTIGQSASVDEKIRKINDIIIERYQIKYSTIVIFNGTEYEIKASNVQEKHWDTLKQLHNEEIFKDSITTATPKYITVNNDSERLPYQKMEFGRAKSAIFFPLYIDNVYIGYWIIESGEARAFEKIDTTILEVIKDNIISVYKNLLYQNIVESLPKKDMYSGLKSAEYLYGEGKKVIDKYTTSTVCMFRIINLEEINEIFNRETGNEVITKISEYIKTSISPEYIFVRYMGPRFVIVFSGVEVEAVSEFLADLKQRIESFKIEKVEKTKLAKTTKGTKKKKYAEPELNFVLSTYYKGTALEEVTKKLEEYINSADIEESDINYI